MKILLLGENSGLYRYLKQGLVEMGHDVVWASDGDGWKHIPGEDIVLLNSKPGKSILKKVKRYIISPLLDGRFKNYDIVQLVSPGVFFWPIIPAMFRKIKRNNKEVFVSISGLSLDMYKCWKSGDYGISYQMFFDSPNLLSEYESESIWKKLQWNFIDSAYNMVDGLIPVIPFEYELPYKNRSNIRKAIPLPINADEIQYMPNVVNDKIVFFHGINSIESKGSDIIIRAMKAIEAEYKDQVKCIVADRMPYEKYLSAVNSANVIIDQCKSYAYGMNACISMGKGKVVMSGAEKPVFYEIPKEECPIVNIIPNEAQIVSAMKELIDKKEEFEEMGKKGRKYVEKYHDYMKIAKMYVSEWQK